ARNTLASSTRRSGRVVDCAGLENRCARKGTVGSNPTSSVETGEVRMPLGLRGSLTIAALLLMIASACEAQPANADLVKATLLADVDAIAPGGSFTLGVRLKVTPGWHVYWVNPGETGDATRVT